ncbi:MAG: hypothetical protein PUB17_09930 [Lachnospiraceae bacterium]|nr:hypothetical protein [Lachnospiraceae bacterium]
MSFFCLQCGMDMHKPERICPYCKSVQYEEPSAVNMAAAAKALNGRAAGRKSKSRLYDYTDEELLATGLYPDDEAYRMGLISNVLNKKK